MRKTNKIFKPFARLSPLLLIMFLLVISACSSDTGTNSDNGDNVNGTETETAENEIEQDDVTYENSVEEIISKNCLSCHGNESPTMAEFDEDPEKYEELNQGPRLDDYENLIVVVNGSEAGALMRRLDNGENTEDGNPGNMYHHLGADDEEREENLEVLKEWVGHWTLKRSNELTDEDKEKFKVIEK